MKQYLIRLKMQANGNFLIEGMNQEIAPSVLQRTGHQTFINSVLKNVHEFLQSENQKETGSMIPKDTTAYEVLSSSVHFAEGLTSVVIYVVIFYKGINLKIQFNNTQTR